MTKKGISRRSFLNGAVAAAGVGILSACTSPAEETMIAATEAPTEAVAAAVPTTAPTAAPTVAPTATEAPKLNLTPGTYSSTVTGRNGEFTVSVTFSEDSIIDVTVNNHAESAQFGAKALAAMPQQVVEAQSVEIDTFAGATMTSGAFKMAVADCIEQAGNAEAFAEAPAEAEVKDDTLTTQVVVVGSGIGGQAAALAAAEAGAKVIMLEKLSISGGAGTGSGGAVLAAGSPLQIEANGVTDPAELVKHLDTFAEGKANKDLIQFCAENSAGIIEWYMNYGVQFELGETAGASVFFSHRALNPDGSGNKSGSFIFAKTYPAFLALGGICLLNTRATGLLQDDSGKIIGVTATNEEHNFTINCDAVILAAGGYEYDKDLLAKWSPHCGMQMVDALCHVGDTGDGILMGLDAGGTFVGAGYGMTTAGYTPLAAIKVTVDGKRYSDELHTEDGYARYQFKAFYDAGAQWTYTLFDSSMLDEAATTSLQKAIDGGTKMYQGDTLEAVAEAAGINVDGFVAEVKHWNEMVDAGEDTDFGTDVTKIGKYEDGPFYLIPYTMVINGTAGGLKIDFDSQVLREDGSVIEGLYAAGETCDGEYYYRLYPSGGGSWLFGSVTGRIGGTNAAKLALGA